MGMWGEAQNQQEGNQSTQVECNAYGEVFNSER
jgi:hypothetical protein